MDNVSHVSKSLTSLNYILYFLILRIYEVNPWKMATLGLGEANNREHVLEETLKQVQARKVSKLLLTIYEDQNYILYP